MSGYFNINVYSDYANTQLWPLFMDVQKSAVESVYPSNMTKFCLGQFPENLEVTKLFQNTVWGIVGGGILSAAAINLLTQRSKSVIALQIGLAAFTLHQCDLPIIPKCAIAGLSALGFAWTSVVEGKKKLESVKQLEKDREYRGYRQSLAYRFYNRLHS